MDTNNEILSRKILSDRKRQAWLGVLFVATGFTLFAYKIWQWRQVG